MKYRKQILIFFGVFDLLFFSFLIGRSIIQSQIPFWSQMLVNMEAMDSFFDDSVLLNLKWIYAVSAILTASSLVSGWLLISRNIIGVKLALIQAIFKLGLMVAPSFFIVSLVLVKVFSTPEVVAFLVAYLMEIIKSVLLIKIYKDQR